MTRSPELLAGICALAVLTACGDAFDPVAHLPRPTEATVWTASEAEVAAGEVLEGSYIVAFRAPTGTAARGYASYLSEARTQHAWLDQRFLGDPRVKDLRFITTVDLANPGGGAASDFDAPGPLRLAWGQDRLAEIPAALTEVTFQSEADARAALGEWDQRGAIWFAEPNGTSKLSGVDYDPPVYAAAQDGFAATLEVEAYKQATERIWWHKAINLAQALEFASGVDMDGIQRPIIAVLDSGVDALHPGLADRVWVNPAPGVSNCVDDVNGCDTTAAKKGLLGVGRTFPFKTSGPNEPCPGRAGEAAYDVCSHGTHVAGIIAGKLEGDVGGVCPVCLVMPIKIIKDVKGKGVALDSAILNGLKYLTLFKRPADGRSVVRIANASFGKATRSRAVAVVVSVLKKPPHEVLIIGAAGNEDTMLRSYPAALNDAIAVSALAPDKAKAAYSNFGPWVDVAAPGGERRAGGDESDPGKIHATLPGGRQGGKQGTSMATPVVAGVAGLILAVNPQRSFDALKASLVNTADDAIYAPGVRLNRDFYYYKPAGESKRYPLLGNGLLDARAAIEGTKVNQIAKDARERVGSMYACAVVAGGGAATGALALLLLTLPLLAAARPGVSSSSRGHDEESGREGASWAE